MWTHRDLDICHTLASRVRLLSEVQAAGIWWTGQRSIQKARKRLEQLVGSGMLVRYDLLLHPLNDFQNPVFCWMPGDSTPDFELLAGSVQQRWERPSEPTRIYIASKRCCILFASYNRGDLPPLSHWNHDHLLSEAYSQFRRAPGQSAVWVGEDELGKAGWGIKDPDAFVLDQRGGNVLRVIESAGRYNSDQVASFHHYCCKRSYAYELW